MGGLMELGTEAGSGAVERGVVDKRTLLWLLFSPELAQADRERGRGGGVHCQPPYSAHHPQDNPPAVPATHLRSTRSGVRKPSDWLRPLLMDSTDAAREALGGSRPCNGCPAAAAVAGDGATIATLWVGVAAPSNGAVVIRKKLLHGRHVSGGQAMGSLSPCWHGFGSYFSQGGRTRRHKCLINL